LSRPTIPEDQEKPQTAEKLDKERIIKHGMTVAACAFVAILVVQCAERYWNESDFSKAIGACNVKTSLKVDQAELGSLENVAVAAMQAKNECIKGVLEFYQKAGAMRPIITIDKNDAVR
jgi:hypothetical protein